MMLKQLMINYIIIVIFRLEKFIKDLKSLQIIIEFFYFTFGLRKSYFQHKLKINKIKN
jgi:hypothetical protein